MPQSEAPEGVQGGCDSSRGRGRHAQVREPVFHSSKGVLGNIPKSLCLSFFGITSLRPHTPASGPASRKFELAGLCPVGSQGAESPGWSARAPDAEPCLCSAISPELRLIVPCAGACQWRWTEDPLVPCPLLVPLLGSGAVCCHTFCPGPAGTGQWHKVLMTQSCAGLCVL